MQCEIAVLISSPQGELQNCVDTDKRKQEKNKRMVGMDTQKPGSESGLGLDDEQVALFSIY